MRDKHKWPRSEIIAGLAMVVAFGSLALQYLNHEDPYAVQHYIDQTQASNAIIESVEEVISTRQFVMIDVEWNVYDPRYASQMSLSQMNKDARVATPVVQALGAYRTKLQNNIKFFDDRKTVAALFDMNAHLDKAVSCFTILASARHKVTPSQEQLFRERITASCNGANEPPSLESFKNAEYLATRAMENERAADRDS